MTQKASSKQVSRKEPNNVEQVNKSTKIKCKICSMPAKVTETGRKRLDNGTALITGQVVCTGKHKHRYSQREIV